MQSAPEEIREGNDKHSVFGIIGLGLIGGSMGLVLKEGKDQIKIIGYDQNKDHEQKALSLHLVDEIMPLSLLVKSSDVIIVAIPVDASEQLLPKILELITNQVIIEVGSTKERLIRIVKDHPKRGRLVLTHPMWGTEYSGPEAALSNAFTGKATVLCSKDQSDPDAVETAEQLYKTLGMHIVYMNGQDHDVHVAYISHISHITSFALANTVLEKEKEEDAIFELASAGFESTVRLAKSNPDMWVPIFMQNRENILDVLNEHISQLRKFKACLEKENIAYLQELITNANKIKRILK